MSEQALSVSSCSFPGQTVPIAVWKQLVATWVQTKQLLYQQIESQMDAVSQVTFFKVCGGVSYFPLQLGTSSTWAGPKHQVTSFWSLIQQVYNPSEQVR